jgi:hypothetical protein
MGKVLEIDELIKVVCKKCRYWQNGCLFDYGNSLTKIPCRALVELYKLIEDYVEFLEQLIILLKKGP